METRRKKRLPGRDIVQEPEELLYPESDEFFDDLDFVKEFVKNDTELSEDFIECFRCFEKRIKGLLD